MRHLLSHRVLFFGGKGGVGKTTCAAATALAASRAGMRVLLVSTDPAHSTSDILGTAVGSSEREIAPRLFGLEIDAAAEAADYVTRVKQQARELFPQAAERALAQIELAASMPGIEEAALFDRVSMLIAEQSDRYDLLIFDTAPTGHTLQLLRTPDAMVGWLRALVASRRAMLPADRRENDSITTTLESRIQRLDALRARLTARGVTGFVLVLIPERLPIDETARAAEQLADSGIDVVAVVVNRVLPTTATGSFVEARRTQEQVYLAEIARRFAGYRRAYVAQRPSDVHGFDEIAAIAAALAEPS